jgi:crossover junction endodeoxyribonuclease RuvC
MATRILGIDPGSRSTGYGLVEAQSPTPRVVACGHVRPRASAELADRLHAIHTELARLIEAHAPDVVAVETAFFHKHARSALVLGHVRGIVLLAARQAELPVYEYAPREIKLAITGAGGAAKEQVAFMVQGMLGLREAVSLDVTDALAAALCHWHRARTNPVLQR